MAQIRAAVAATCVASCCLLPLRAHSAAAEQSAGAPELGVLPAVQVECRIIGRESGMWWPPQGSFVCAETLQVSDNGGRAFEPVAGDPKPGQFAWRAEGAIRFSPEDAGRRIIVRYQFQPRRAAILAGVPDRDCPDALPMFGEALSEVLGKRGFVMVATEEVAEASKAEGLGAISLLDPPSAERLAPLAKRLEAAYLLIPYADVTSYSQSGTVEIEVPAPTDRPGDVHPGTGLLPGDMESIPVPVTRHSLQAGVRVRVVEGDTGKAVWDVVRYATRGVHLRQFTSARRELMREVAEQVVVIWREPALR